MTEWEGHTLPPLPEEYEWVLLMSEPAVRDTRKNRPTKYPAWINTRDSSSPSLISARSNPGSVYPFDTIPDALAYLAARAHLGMLGETE